MAEAPLMPKSSSHRNRLLTELELLKKEVVGTPGMTSRTMQSNDIDSLKPSYRAILARRGFLVRETLGSGSYSKVKFAHVFRDDVKYIHAAVKILDRQRAPRDFQQKFLPREMEIWPRVKHTNIIQVIELFEEDNKVFMVLEFAPNGDMLRYIQQRGAISEDESRKWFSQLEEAVYYLHHQNITHRDLKLENLLLDNKTLKVGDFGFVKEGFLQELSKTFCGSKSYACPEILKGQPYDAKKADIWAMGVVLFIFVTGNMPFDETLGNKGVLEEQRKLRLQWNGISKSCREYILSMFTYNFQQRPDIDTVHMHPWLDRKTVALLETDAGNSTVPVCTSGPMRCD